MLRATKLCSVGRSSARLLDDMGQVIKDVFEAELSVIGAVRQVAASASGGSESSGYLLMTQTSLLDAIAGRTLNTSCSQIIGMLVLGTHRQRSAGKFSSRRSCICATSGNLGGDNPRASSIENAIGNVHRPVPS